MKKKIITVIILWVLLNVVLAGIYSIIRIQRNNALMKESRKMMVGSYGLNRRITGGDYDRELAVRCHNGIFVGREKNDVLAYKGIPFAKPPTGELRWKRPVQAERSDNVYEAYYFGKSCIQTAAETERASFYPQGEDCLTLNVWTNNKGPKEGRPVMVFFHGGAYGWGGTSDPLYDGQNFAEAQPDVVLVTVNYRVGLMGFVDLSMVEGGEDYKESGNLGLLDQICALKWIQRNIGKFGGDPGQVTIFGESAGGSSVSLLPLIDEAEGLFKRVIAQSGSPAFTFSKEECRTFTDKLMKEAKASNMKDLLSLSEKDLKKINRKLNDCNNFPERDGIILPEDVFAPYEQGKTAGIDMLIGTNADEARYWIGEVGGYRVYRVAGELMYKSIVSKLKKTDRRYVKEFMRLQHGKRIWNRTELINELVFRIPAIAQAQAHALNGGRTYMYYWTKKSAIPHYGACHAVELAYVFGNVDDKIFTGERADEDLSRTVQQMWVNFAKTGDPGTTDHPWELYDAVRRQTMFIGDEIIPVSDPLKEQRKLVEPLLAYRYNGYYKVAEDAVNVLLRDVGVFMMIVGALQGIAFLAWNVGKNIKLIRRRKETGTIIALLGRIEYN